MKKINYFKTFLFAGLLCSLPSAFGQTEVERKKITSDYNNQEITKLSRSFLEKEKEDKSTALAFAKTNNIPVFVNLEDGGFAELQRIEADGSLIYYRTFNVAAAKSTRTNHLNTGGTLGLKLDGQNMIAYVWDGGHARASHQEYDGPGGTNRVIIADAATEGGTRLNFHAAHVTGTITASGVVANAKGMAPQSKVRGYMWNNDLSEATTAAANGMLVSNHSYGLQSIDDSGNKLLPSYYAGAYIGESEDWDRLMYNAPNYLMVVAAGNDGNSSITTNPLAAGFDKLTGHATSKNNLVVANAQDANIDTNGNLVSVSINSSSSQGPTDDLRIKPDITGNGTSVYSTYQNSDTAYASITGTSMASPNVTGTLLLLQQHYNNLNGSFMRSATLKGLVLHTADDAGLKGPDAVFGWGLLNAKKAAQTISQKGDKSLIDQRTLLPGQSYTITVNSDGVNKLLASICWTDPAGTATTTLNSSMARLVNDLDIRITKAGTTYLPWLLTGVNTNGLGDNKKDPFERVEVSGASGQYTITITHKGTLTNGSQNYTLIVTGITNNTTCNATVPTDVTTSGITTSTATVNWSSVTGATYEVAYKATSATTWTFVTSASTSLALSGLTADTDYEVRVKSLCSDGTSSAFSATSNFTTTASTNGSTCNATVPTGITTSGITTSTATVSWSSVTGATYQVAYKATSATTWTFVTSTSTSLALSGLTADTTYQVAVKSLCSTSGTSSAFSALANFTTTASTNDSTCNATVPTGITTSGITTSTATVSWSSVTGATYQVAYKATSASTWTFVTSTSTSRVLSGLTAGTTYQVAVKSLCSSGTSSVFSATLNFKTAAAVSNPTYCISKGNSQANEWIDYVALNGMTNTTGSNYGYGNFTATKIAPLPYGYNSITFSAGFRFYSYTEYWSIWIDYNKNGIFESTEKVVSGSSSSSANLGATFIVPTTALAGKTRMRVQMKYGAASTPCETFSAGEVEDYTVNIGSYTTASLSDGDEISDERNIFDFDLFPNPTSNTLSVKMFDNRAVSYKVYNLMGQALKSDELTQDINVSDLASGLYILEINDGYKVITKKFSKK